MTEQVDPLKEAITSLRRLEEYIGRSDLSGATTAMGFHAVGWSIIALLTQGDVLTIGTEQPPQRLNDAAKAAFE